MEEAIYEPPASNLYSTITYNKIIDAVQGGAEGTGVEKQSDWWEVSPLLPETAPVWTTTTYKEPIHQVHK